MSIESRKLPFDEAPRVTWEDLKPGYDEVASGLTRTQSAEEADKLRKQRKEVRRTHSGDVWRVWVKRSS